MQLPPNALGKAGEFIAKTLLVVIMLQ